MTIRNLWYNIKYSSFVAGYVHAAYEAVAFIRQCLSTKKILVLSDKRIVSIPISGKLQTVAALFSVSLMLWVSYATSKYLAYGDIISEKERELWTTSVTNGNLQYQMADLHNNLEDLNKYFSDLQKYEEISDKKAPAAPSKNDEVSEAEPVSHKRVMAANTRQDPQREAQRILSTINTKVKQRISSLENVMGSTGIAFKKILENNTTLQQAMTARRPSVSKTAQGGPFIPDNSAMPYALDKAAFSADIHYLLALEKALHAMPVASPLTHYYITSHFGRRVDPMRRVRAIHQGLDMVGKQGARVYSSAAGKVVFAGVNGAYGRFIEIDHGSGISTRYGHLSKIFVEEGLNIKKGQVVGLQGSSGRSTGSHLHYEVRFEGRPLDPYQFLKAGQYVF